MRIAARRCGYLETLKAGAARIDLEGNPVGTVTTAGEEDAKRKIAKAARRAAATAIKDRKEAGQPAAKPDNKTHSQRQNLDNWPARPNRLSGWLTSRRPQRLAGGGSSPRSDAVAVINRI
jgi:sRNA-binding protein